MFKLLVNTDEKLAHTAIDMKILGISPFLFKLTILLSFAVIPSPPHMTRANAHTRNTSIYLDFIFFIHIMNGGREKGNIKNAKGKKTFFIKNRKNFKWKLFPFHF